MTTGYYCAIFPFCGGGKKKTKRQRHFMTGLPQVSQQKIVQSIFYSMPEMRYCTKSSNYSAIIKTSCQGDDGNLAIFDVAP